MAAGSLDNLELDETEGLLHSYLDGDLDEASLERVVRRLEEEPELRQDLDGLEVVVKALGDLPFEFAPDDFVERVQGRMRKQSAGRLFAQNLLLYSRVPYEAIAVVMIIVMAAAYLLLEPPMEVEVRDGDAAGAVIAE